MAEYYAFQAAIGFSIVHIFVHRGLVYSNALTGSLISLGTTAAIFWLLAVLFIPLSNMIVPAMAYFIAAGIFAPGRGQTLGYIGMARIGRGAIRTHCEYLADFFIGTGGLFVARSLDCPECDRYLPGHSRRRDTFLGQTYAGPVA